MKVYDYRCTHCGTVEEHFVKNSGVRSAICGECGHLAERMVPCPRFTLDGCDPAYPTAYDKWGKDHERMAKEANRKSEANGE